MAKNQAKAKQHLQVEAFLFENYSLSSSTLSSRNNKAYSKIFANEQVCLSNEITWLIIMKIKIKTKNASHSYDKNRPRPRQGYKHTKHKVSRYDDHYM